MAYGDISGWRGYKWGYGDGSLAAQKNFLMDNSSQADGGISRRSYDESAGAVLYAAGPLWILYVFVNIGHSGSGLWVLGCSQRVGVGPLRSQ